MYKVSNNKSRARCYHIWRVLVGRLGLAYYTSDWPRTLFTPRVFLFSISLLFGSIIRCYY